MLTHSPRVLFVTKRVDVGGAEMHLAHVLPELQRRRLDVSLFVLERGGRLEPRFTGAGLTLAGVPRSGGRAGHIARAAHALAGVIRQQRPDIVHYFLPEPYLVGCFVAPFTTPCVRIMSRRSLAEYQQRHPLLGRLEHRMHAGTAVLLGNSTAVVNELINECRTPHKVGLIHNGIPLSEPAPEVAAALRRTLGIGETTLTLITVANLIGYKGHADLIDALAIARPQLPSDWRLLMVGRDGGIGADLVARANRVGIGANVDWLGERDDASGLLQAADMAVVASHQEGFSNSLIEAMAAGLPLVATAVGGNVDAVVHRETGLLVPARDPRAMADAITTLAADPALRRRLGAAGQHRARTLFSLDACVDRYERLYRSFVTVAGRPVQSLIDGERV